MSNKERAELLMATYERCLKDPSLVRSGYYAQMYGAKPPERPFWHDDCLPTEGPR